MLIVAQLCRMCCCVVFFFTNIKLVCASSIPQSLTTYSPVIYRCGCSAVAVSQFAILQQSSPANKLIHLLQTVLSFWVSPGLDMDGNRVVVVGLFCLGFKILWCEAPLFNIALTCLFPLQNRFDSTCAFQNAQVLKHVGSQIFNYSVYNPPNLLPFSILWCRYYQKMHHTWVCGCDGFLLLWNEQLLHINQGFLSWWQTVLLQVACSGEFTGVNWKSGRRNNWKT